MFKHSNDSGHAAAENYKQFVGAYQIRKTEWGTVVSPSVDGHVTGTCDRCGTAIMNVYIFANNQNLTMHVGIDCMRKMGIPLAECRKASGYWREQARKVAASERAAMAETRKAAIEEMHKANLQANSALVDELDSLAASPCANSWEVFALEGLKRSIAWGDAAKLLDPDEWQGERLEVIRTRIALCNTSTDQAKPGRITLTLEVYRDSIGFPTQYGNSYRNFLTDGVNAFTYKGTHSFKLGEKVTATWTCEGVNVYDSLTSTVLKRPAKIAVA